MCGSAADIEAGEAALRAAASLADPQAKDGEDLRKSAIKALEREYPELGRRFIALLAKINEARQAVLGANANLPEHCSPLTEPEAILDQHPTSRQIIRENAESKWVFEFNPGVPLDDRAADRDTAMGAERGTLPSNSGNPIRVRRESFRRIEFVPDTSWRRGGRLAEMRIPGLRADEPDFWPGDETRAAASIAMRLERQKIPPAPPVVRVEYIPLDGAPERQHPCPQAEPATAA
jgi:hypothetical protein